MKKFIMLSAVMAAVSTAFVACSSDDDLAQQPKAPETTVDTPKGTPFSLSVSADTRSTLYNANAWDKTDGVPWVKEIKIYGNQADVSNIWMNSVVFKRDSYNADWVANRSAAAGSITELNWPSENTDKATTFYAISDGDIMGAGTTAAISNVQAWMSTEGTFIYNMELTKKTDNVPHIDPYEGTCNLLYPATDYVDEENPKDLMVASATKKESETTDGKLELAFSHVLAGLNIKLIFRNDNYYTSGQVQTIQYIKVMGLKTKGTYTFNPTGTTPNWDTSENVSLCYYKNFGTSPIQITADPQSYTAAQADHNKWLVAKDDPWMVIPQTTTPWDGLGLATGNAAENYIQSGAYIVLGLSNEDMDDVEAFLPLNTTFVAGTNKTLRLDLAQFRDLYSGTAGDPAAFLYGAATGGGGSNPARGYDIIDE